MSYSEFSNTSGPTKGEDFDHMEALQNRLRSINSYDAVIRKIGRYDGEFFADVYRNGVAANPTETDFLVYIANGRDTCKEKDHVKVEMWPAFGIILPTPYLMFLKISQDWDVADGNILKGKPTDSQGHLFNELPEIKINVYWEPRIKTNYFIYSGYKKDDTAPYIRYPRPYGPAVGWVLSNQGFPSLTHQEQVIKLGPGGRLMADYPRLRRILP